MTIRDALKLAEEILLDAGVPDARLDAEYLLAGVLDAPRLLVVASGETPLTDARAEQFFTLVARRQSREPLQYILGTQPFMGCSFCVDERVLIPRQDTETLAEAALIDLRERPGRPEVLDLCAGSGCIGLSIASLAPRAEIGRAHV